MPIFPTLLAAVSLVTGLKAEPLKEYNSVGDPLFIKRTDGFILFRYAE